MSVDLIKNRTTLLEYWRDVLDDKTSTNWALFGYEGQTNILKPISKGSYGIEELIEDLNSGKIMYAFVKINDPKTSLDKCVLINWQGEGANTIRKGICANHLRDVERFFTGAHLTINARNEEEVEPQLIVDKVAKAGSAYNFKSLKYKSVIEPATPVGTTYQRVNPIKEINLHESNQFWEKEEEEEKKRVEEERKRRETEKLRHEQELKKREMAEAAKRETETNLRNNSIDRIKEAEESIKISETPQYIEEVLPKINQSDVMRKQRNQEAQDLIAQRTIDARSIFERNTCAGQMKKVPEKPVRSSLLKAQAQAESKNDVENNEKANDESDEENDQFSTIKRSPKDHDKKNVPIDTETSQNHIDLINEANQDDAKTAPDLPIEQQITEQQFVDEYIYGLSSPGLQARALYDYQAADDTEITFDPGDIITNIDQVDEGWWQGLGPDGTYGLFPANYVELIQ